MPIADAPVRTNQSRESASAGAVYVPVPVSKAAGGWIEVSYVPDSGTSPRRRTQEHGAEAREDPKVALLFPVLAEWWHSDTDAMSIDRDKFEHPAYKRITGFGKAALRYILADLRDRHGHWYEALRQLANDDRIDANANGNMRRARDAWLNWGKAHNLI